MSIDFELLDETVMNNIGNSKSRFTKTKFDQPTNPTFGLALIFSHWFFAPHKAN